MRRSDVTTLALWVVERGFAKPVQYIGAFSVGVNSLPSAKMTFMRSPTGMPALAGFRIIVLKCAAASGAGDAGPRASRQGYGMEHP